MKAGWQPIETCPEHNPVLVWCPVKSDYDATMDSSVWVVVKDSDGDFSIEHDGDGGYLHWRGLTPTHWQYPPGPPE